MAELNLTDRQVIDLFYTYRPTAWFKDKVSDPLDMTLDQWQYDFLRDETKRLLLLVHRQGGKSTIVAVKAIHRALFRRGQTIVLVSPTQRQSSELLHKVRHIVKMIPEYSDSLIVDNVTSVEFANGSRIISLPDSPWTIRGYTADLVIIDEAAGVSDDVWTAVSPMLLTTQGQYIVVSTPQSKSGAFYQAYCSDTWQKYIVKASENPRMQSPEYADFLAREKVNLGSRLYSQEYECEFLDDMDVGLIKRSWWKFYDPKELDLKGANVYVSFDTASKDKEMSDYSVATVWARVQHQGEEERNYMLRMDDDKVLFPDLEKLALSLYEEYNPTQMLIEDKASGIALIQSLKRRKPGIRIKPIEPTGSKIERLNRASSLIENGQVYLPARKSGDIYIPTDAAEKIITNMALFPNVEHDDITDSVDQYLNFISTKKSGGTIRFI